MVVQHWLVLFVAQKNAGSHYSHLGLVQIASCLLPCIYIYKYIFFSGWLVLRCSVELFPQIALGPRKCRLMCVWVRARRF